MRGWIVSLSRQLITPKRQILRSQTYVEHDAISQEGGSLDLWGGRPWATPSSEIKLIWFASRRPTFQCPDSLPVIVIVKKPLDARRPSSLWGRVTPHQKNLTELWKKKKRKIPKRSGGTENTLMSAIKACKGSFSVMDTLVTHWNPHATAKTTQHNTSLQSKNPANRIVAWAIFQLVPDQNNTNSPPSPWCSFHIRVSTKATLGWFNEMENLQMYNCPLHTPSATLSCMWTCFTTSVGLIFFF